MLMYRKYSAVLRDRTVSRYPRESTLLLKSTTKHNFQASNPTPQTTSPSAQAEGCSHFTLHVPKWSAGPVHHLQRSKSPNLAPGEERGGKTVGHPWGAPADSGISDGDPSLSKWLSIWNWTQKKKLYGYSNGKYSVNKKKRISWYSVCQGNKQQTIWTQHPAKAHPKTPVIMSNQSKMYCFRVIVLLTRRIILLKSNTKHWEESIYKNQLFFFYLRRDLWRERWMIKAGKIPSASTWYFC